MLTCKVGEKIINCFDGIYNKHQLKKWSDKNILICPDCGGIYEYCHGQVVPPYFRHKEKSKDCESIFSEPETKEHLNGKLLLYKWLLPMQEQGIIQNLKLEAYIPETKQRPDIYFELDNKRYVIEFQCSPIATEYLERHELYQLANVNDIWVLGLDKYNLKIDSDRIFHETRFKEIEKHNDCYLDANTSELIISSRLISRYLPYHRLFLRDYYKFQLADMFIDSDLKNISPRNNILQPFIDEDQKLFTIGEKRKLAEQSIVEDTKQLAEFFNEKYSKINKSYKFYQSDWEYGRYLSKISFYNTYVDLVFFINKESIDCCTPYQVSIPFRGKKGGTKWTKQTRYKNIANKKYDFADIDIIKRFIWKTVSDFIRQNIYKDVYTGGKIVGKKN